MASVPAGRWVRRGVVWLATILVAVVFVASIVQIVSGELGDRGGNVFALVLTSIILSGRLVVFLLMGSWRRRNKAASST
jgi:hypothetical protein